MIWIDSYNEDIIIDKLQTKASVIFIIKTSHFNFSPHNAFYSLPFFPKQEAIAEEQRMAARFANDIDIAKAQRDFELKKAAYDQEVHTKKAQSDLSYDLQVKRVWGGRRY